MNTHTKQTDIERNRKGYSLNSGSKTMLLRLRRQMRSHYDIFKEGRMNKKEYLATIKPIDKNISKIEMSVL